MTSAVVADAPSAAGETPNVTATEQSGAPAVGAPWGGKTSFAQVNLFIALRFLRFVQHDCIVADDEN